MHLRCHEQVNFIIVVVVVVVVVVNQATASLFNRGKRFNILVKAHPTEYQYLKVHIAF